MLHHRTTSPAPPHQLPPRRRPPPRALPQPAATAPPPSFPFPGRLPTPSRRAARPPALHAPPGTPPTPSRCAARPPPPHAPPDHRLPTRQPPICTAAAQDGKSNTGAGPPSSPSSPFTSSPHPLNSLVNAGVAMGISKLSPPCRRSGSRCRRTSRSDPDAISHWLPAAPRPLRPPCLLVGPSSYSPASLSPSTRDPAKPPSTSSLPRLPLPPAPRSPVRGCTQHAHGGCSAAGRRMQCGTHGRACLPAWSL